VRGDGIEGSAASRGTRPEARWAVQWRLAR
jgi:hypothetical protein